MPLATWRRLLLAVDVWSFFNARLSPSVGLFNEAGQKMCTYIEFGSMYMFVYMKYVTCVK